MAKGNGRWYDVQFDTAQDAVNCATAIQRASRADFQGELRIGIHLGDITFENGDVYGDGVNIAARLESLADPGGIYISDSVEKSIRGHLDIKTLDLGEKELKNVAYPVKVYALQGTGLPIPRTFHPKEPKSSKIVSSKKLPVYWSIALVILIGVMLYL